MTVDSPLLLLTGTHPAAAWLANALAARQVPVLWAHSPRPRQTWWALTPHAFTPYGEDPPVWPLEWAYQLTQALALFHPEHGWALSARESTVLDLQRMHTDLFNALQRRQIPHIEKGDLAPTRWQVEIAFAPCKKCPHWEYSGQLEQAPSPAGLVEGHRLDQGMLWSSSLGAQHSAFSYRSETADSEAMQADLKRHWPHQHGPFAEENWHPACHCAPTLHCTERHLLLTISPPSLHPQAQLAQSLIWMLGQALIRWLSSDSAVLETLDRDWLAYLDKVSAAPVRHGQIHKFPGDPA